MWWEREVQQREKSERGDERDNTENWKKRACFHKLIELSQFVSSTLVKDLLGKEDRISMWDRVSLNAWNEFQIKSKQPLSTTRKYDVYDFIQFLFSLARPRERPVVNSNEKIAV